MTRPNEMAPFHILRMVCQYPFYWFFSVLTRLRRGRSCALSMLHTVPAPAWLS